MSAAPAAASRTLVLLAFVAFVSLGLPDCVLGVAWPSVRHTFGQPLGSLGQLLAAGTVGYLCSSFLGGQLLRAVGVGKLLAGSCALVTLSLVAWCLAPAWPLVVIAAAIGGLGAGAIDAGINAVAAARFSARVVNWLHASWGIGATTGPLLMTAVIVGGVGWRAGYAILAAALLGLTILFVATRRAWGHAEAPASESTAAAGAAEPAPSALNALRRPAVVLHALLFFLYTGAEATAGQLLFTLFTESRGAGIAAAGVAIGAYWGALTVGRVVFGQLTATLGRAAVLRTGMALAPLAAALVAWGPAWPVTYAATALLGFAFAPIFPTLIAVTPDRVGRKFAAHAVGFQIAAAAAGIATFPGVIASVARQTGLEIVCTYLIAATLAIFALHELVMRLTLFSGLEQFPSARSASTTKLLFSRPPTRR
jgi:MFS family permease